MIKPEEDTFFPHLTRAGDQTDALYRHMSGTMLRAGTYRKTSLSPTINPSGCAFENASCT